MASIEEIRRNRLSKIKVLEGKGINPYPINSKQDFTLAEIVHDFDKLSKRKNSISIVGRVIALRPQGGLTFLNLSDGTGQFQVLMKQEELSGKLFDLFSETSDIGDFIQFQGSLFITKRNEKTLLAKKWTMLAKSLRPLPEKWHGLQDIEERFRKRYLDALMSLEVKNCFILRSKLISEIRNILDKNNYLEVDTPALQPLYGGASAIPFTTHHNALDIDLYLRISNELYLKRMLIAGFPKVYEIAKDFRNEGIDATHNPEFTQLEFYESYSNVSKQMVFVEKMLKLLVKKLFNKDLISYGGQEIDFGKKFAVISYFNLLKRHALIPNPESASENEIRLVASQLGVKIEQGDSVSKILDNIYKKTCRPKLIQPTFIVDYPAEYLPLAKNKEDNKKLVDAFQLIAGGIELVKAFSELNDPIEQRKRFLGEEGEKKKGNNEAQPLDEDFLEALEYGMPPTGGVGIGLDRLAMLLTDAHNIKEVIFFPTMRPR